MSTVFVTGANGFIGTHLVRALDRPRGAPPVLDFDPRRRETPPRNKHFGAGSAHGRHARREEHDRIGSIWRSMGKSRASRGEPGMSEPQAPRGALARAAAFVAESWRDWELYAIIDRLIFRPMHPPLVRLLVPTRVRPNQLSASTVLCGVLAFAGYATFTRTGIAVGGAFLFLSVLIDGIDGELARTRPEKTETGKVFEVICDPAKVVLSFLGIAVGMTRTDSWGPLPYPFAAPPVAHIWGLCILAGASLAAQVHARNHWVEIYRRCALGFSEPSYPNLGRVREEYEALCGRRGYWLEKAVVPVVLRLSSSSPRPAPPPPAPAVPGYREALKPYIKTMSFFAGGTQMIVLIATSFAGAPVWALLYIVASNVVFLPLLPLIARAHRRALAAGAAPGPLR